MKRRNIWTVIVVVLVLLGLILAGWFGYRSTTSQRSQTEPKVTLPKSAKLSNSNLILVNKQHPLKKDLSFKKAETDGISYNQKIDQPLTRFLKAAQAAGYPATVVSGYRSKAYQKKVFEQNYQENLNQGMTPKKAKAETKSVIQTPGSSEHATGLAVDVMTNEYWNKHHSLEANSDQTKGQQWLIQHAPDYGFVLRYPKAKSAQKQTGIAYESWHFRYVGVANAKYMTKHHLTLEEYHQMMARQDSAK
ncbi:D-alanyl-D-alanine carboxypeptidase [Weissella uvarum]|uniref:M15 family metallopeptidase n=1 Tax=Weissella uvarum TaxID=1479233 RepID=UPI00195F30A2|nr:M15 family metallopeptidase [Weissella uvarum]MBM7616817.1 D-alanyl-D-alanine carboxypeptidase [Weissella uvarum]MCM0594731.1 M15 family metallopeptidase [Weissella uvarum]